MPGSTRRASSAGPPDADEIARALERHFARVARVIFDAASEGRHVILGMLIVGLIFLGVIALGELAHWAGHRRAARRRSRTQPY